MNEYRNFADLSAHEREGVDYVVEVSDRKGSGVVVISPHGGGIEPGTSEIARAIAGADFSFANFAGIKRTGNRRLHITSSHFDEPRFLDIVRTTKHVIAVHGEESSDRAVAFMGGRDADLRERIRRRLRQAGFTAEDNPDFNLQGLAPDNICNRGTSGSGVQLELSRGLREKFFMGLDAAGRKQPTSELEKFATAIRGALPRSNLPADVLSQLSKIEWRTYETLSAIAAFESYWKELERLIGDAAHIEELVEGPKWKPETDSEIGEFLEEKRIVRYLHDQIATPTFRHSSVVSLFGILEREMRRFADNLAKERKIPISYKDLRGSVLIQVGRFTEAFCGLPVHTQKSYQRVLDLQKVRDCIVHCGADPSLSSDKAHLLRLGSLGIGLEVFEGTPIEIAPAFIVASIEATGSFFVELFERVGWKVNDRWLRR